MVDKRIKLYHNQNNSCYLNSLLSILFCCREGFFVKKILSHILNDIKYPKGIKSLNSKIKDEELETYAKELQTQINDLFFDILRKTHSTILVKKLAECNTFLEYNAPENPVLIYNMLSSFFPDLLIKYNRKELDGIFPREQSVFDITDIDLLRETMTSFPPYIIFSNGGIVQDIDWGEKGYGLKLTVKEKEGEYDLVGMIVHRNQNHFYSLFLSENVWYAYDDSVSNFACKIENFPAHFFNEKINNIVTQTIIVNGQRRQMVSKKVKKQPSMLFYTLRT